MLILKRLIYFLNIKLLLEVMVYFLRRCQKKRRKFRCFVCISLYEIRSILFCFYKKVLAWKTFYLFYKDGIFDATQSPPTHQAKEEIPSHIEENSKQKEVQESNTDVKSNKKIEKNENLLEPKNLLYKVNYTHIYSCCRLFII